MLTFFLMIDSNNQTKKNMEFNQFVEIMLRTAAVIVDGEVCFHGVTLPISGNSEETLIGLQFIDEDSGWRYVIDKSWKLKFHGDSAIIARKDCSLFIIPLFSTNLKQS
jgi:hypothetical protein